MERTDVNETLTMWTAIGSLLNGSDYRACALWGKTWG